MQIRQAQYIGSYPKFKSLPDSEMPEYCFWGRSNVGKSSLINFITNRNDLALTSSTPGKTINFNFFLINESFHIVDLPGYGYARVSRSKRNAWNTEIINYLTKRKNLVSAFLLVDISIPPQDSDLERIYWLGENTVPFAIIFTKSDRCKKAELKFQLNQYRKLLEESWEELPPTFISSAERRSGKDEILEYMETHLANFPINN